MVTPSTLINTLNLKALTTIHNPELSIEGVYISDLLSNVMATCPGSCLWVTMQCHVNVIGVASLLDIQIVLLSSDAKVDPVALRRAEEMEVTVLQSHESAFVLCGQLFNLGLRGALRS